MQFSRLSSGQALERGLEPVPQNCGRDFCKISERFYNKKNGPFQSRFFTINLSKLTLLNL